MHYVIYTDMDGTLIDEHYSSEVVEKTVEELLRREIPIVLCTSKTRAEIELYRSSLGLKDPFIAENGGAIYIESRYFEFDYSYDSEVASEGRSYRVIELGTNYDVLRRVLKEIEEESAGTLELRGFGDMTAEELAMDSGLSLREAELAKMREYDEAFKVITGEKERIFEKVEEKGLHFTAGGRYCHILGDNDKGKAVEILNALFKKRYAMITTIGIGDSFNDLPLLRAVDIPVLVAKPDGSHEYLAEAKVRVRKESGVGPVGWKNVVEDLILRS